MRRTEPKGNRLQRAKRLVHSRLDNELGGQQAGRREANRSCPAIQVSKDSRDRPTWIERPEQLVRVVVGPACREGGTRCRLPDPADNVAAMVVAELDQALR